MEGLEHGVDSADGPPVVLPLREAAERLGDVVARALRLAGRQPTIPSSPATRRSWRSGVLVYVPRGQRLVEPLRLSVASGRRRRGPRLARADRPRGGRRGRGLGDATEPTATSWTASSTAWSSCRWGPGARLRYVCEQELSERSWVFATQRAELAARRLAGLGGARLRLGARQGADGDQARRPRLLGEGHRGLRRGGHPAPRLRHHAGARRRAHHLGPRLPGRAVRSRDRGLARA